jgi:hypothetical protein
VLSGIIFLFHLKMLTKMNLSIVTFHSIIAKINSIDIKNLLFFCKISICVIRLP